MNIRKITENRKRWLPLLLTADEQEDMIDRYLSRGEMFLMTDNDRDIAVCIVTDEGEGICEIKNIAVSENYRGKGYGKQLVGYICRYYKDSYRTIKVGTGETPSSLGFYRSCGFEISHRVENFFIDNYSHTIVEDGVVLKDMIYLERELTD